MRRADSVLHVDDDNSYSRLVQERLRTFGIISETLANGDQTLETVERLNAGIILLDLDLNHPYQGLELLEQIRKLDGDRRVIVLTGVINTSTVLQSMQLGADFCFFKSEFEFQELVDAIHALQFRRFHWSRVARVASDLRRAQREAGDVASLSRCESTNHLLKVLPDRQSSALSESFPRFLLDSNYVPVDVLVKATEYSDKQRPLLGQVALDSGKLDVKQIFRIVEAQSQNREPFGQIAVKLGMLTPADVDQLLEAQRQRRPDIGAALVATGAITQEQLDQYLTEFKAYSASLHVKSAAVATTSPSSLPV